MASGSYGGGGRASKGYGRSTSARITQAKGRRMRMGSNASKFGQLFDIGGSFADVASAKTRKNRGGKRKASVLFDLPF